jgi:hypothetical protein
VTDMTFRLSRTVQLSIIRGWAHDRVCMSGGHCTGDNEHAHRTQHQFAVAVVDARDDDALGRVLHEHLCLGAARAALMGQGSHCHAQTEHLERVMTVNVPEIKRLLEGR